MAERFPVFSDRPDNLLVDVGCGRGDFLVRMKALGWNVLGIEPDSIASGLARARGIAVFTGRLEEARLADGIVDQITLNHVLEHTDDPAGLLRECRRVLRGGEARHLHAQRGKPRTPVVRKGLARSGAAQAPLCLFPAVPAGHASRVPASFLPHDHAAHPCRWDLR
ncbi:MAG: class I SAM-dependent methyltransferase [Syntrophaceae bacterium]|nr:class I SAM-dependent methyltransferase [Syntrophaceae bacterium]